MIDLRRQKECTTQNQIPCSRHVSARAYDVLGRNHKPRCSCLRGTMAARGLKPVGGRLTEVISIPARPGERLSTDCAHYCDGQAKAGHETVVQECVVRSNHICSIAGPARLQALIIPGNPGAAGYYVPFMLSLREAFRGEIDLFAVSQLGHGCVPTSEVSDRHAFQRRTSFETET